MTEFPVEETAQRGEGPSIIFDGVSCSLGGKPLFDNLSMALEGGRCTCVLGPSGCGKSTLLRMIAGTISLPCRGTITIAPECAEKGKIAWMGQNDLLLPWLSLLDNILLGAKLRNENSAARRSKARHLMDKAGLSGYEKALPASLSGGMRQRGALLRTLMEERPVLLMDEPFSALDTLTRLKLQNLSAQLTRKATVVVVTHDPVEALRMGCKILVLSERPARVKSIISLAGTPPRNVDAPEIQAHFGALLDQLLDESPVCM